MISADILTNPELFSQDLIVREAKQGFAEALLVEIVADKANRARENEDGIKKFGVDQGLNCFLTQFFFGDEKVEEDGGQGAVNVKNEVGLFGGGELFYSPSEIEMGMGNVFDKFG